MTIAIFLAELIGTFALIFAGAGAVCLNEIYAGSIGTVGVALAHGLAIAVMVSALAHISGGKFNPAITLGLLAGGKITLPRAILEIAAQLAGAAVAAFFLWVIFPPSAEQAVHLGTPALNEDVTYWRGIFAEAIATFLLVLTVYGTAVDFRGSWNAVGGFAIGSAIIFGILAIGGLTGAALNPARAFGPALISGTWLNQSVYWIGPIIGGVLAGLLYAFYFEREEDEVETITIREVR